MTNIRQTFLLVFSALIICSILWSIPIMATPSDDLELSDVEEFDFNGMQVILRESKDVPSVTALLYFKGGTSVMNSNTEVAEEYMAMNLIHPSASDFTSKQYYRRKMLRMGSGIGGADGRDFSVMTMRSTRENFDTTWKFFSEKITNPTVDLVEFQNFQRNALVGLNEGRQSPEFVARIVLDSMYFLGHPYGKRLNKEELQAVTPERILRHFKELTQTSRLLLVVVGNISRKELVKQLEQYGWQNLPKGNFRMTDLPVPEKSKSPGAYFPPIDRKLPTKYVRGYIRVPSKGSPDYYPYVRLRNFFGGFLFQHLRVQTNLSYAPDITDIEWKESVAMISFETSLVDSAIHIVLRDMDFFVKNQLLESAVKGGVAKYTTNTFLKQESTPEVAAALGQAQLLTGSWKNAFVSYDKLSNVRTEDIQRVAQTYFKNINWVVVGDTRDVDKKLLESK